MKITAVFAKNLKGRSFTHTLSPFTIITGQNSAGKTAIADAVRLALLGYIPALGKTNQATFSLSSDKELRAGVRLDNDTEFDRIWTNNGKISATVTGQPPTFPPVLMDLNEFFGLTGAKRVQYVFERIKLGDTQTPESILDEIGWSDYLPDSLGATLQTWLVDAVTAAANEKSRLTAECKRLTGAITTVAAQSGPPDVPLAEIESRLKGARERESTLKTAIGVAANDAQKRQSLKDNIARAKLAWDGAELLTDDELNELATKADKFDSIQRELSEVQERVLEGEREATELRSRMNSLDIEADGHRKRMDKALKHECCPTCGTKGDGWKDTLRKSVSALCAVLMNDKAKVLTESNVVEKRLAENNKDETRLVKQLAECEQAERDLAKAQSLIKGKAEAMKSVKDMERMLALFPKAKDIEADKAELNEIVNTITALENSRRVSLAAQNEKIRAEQSKQERRKAENDLDAAKRTHARLLEIQQELVSGAFSTILARVNKLAGLLLPFPLDYLNGEIGMNAKDGWIPHTTFSGTEQAAVYAGLSLALCQDAPIRIVIMDELGRLSRESKATLQKCVVKMLRDGDLDQFIGLDVSAADWFLKKSPDSLFSNIEV